jgi:hypothetical protein
LKKSAEFNTFNIAMGTILKADPKAVKAAVDAEIQAHTAERKAKGERKRGRKPKAQRTTSALDHVSNVKD